MIHVFNYKNIQQNQLNNSIDEPNNTNNKKPNSKSYGQLSIYAISFQNLHSTDKVKL